MEYNDRNYLIFPVDQLSNTNFNEVLEILSGPEWKSPMEEM